MSLSKSKSQQSEIAYCCGDTDNYCAWGGHGYHCRGGAYGGCGQTFTSVSTFKNHLTRGDDKCIDPRKLDLVQDERGHWHIPAPEGGFSWFKKAATPVAPSKPVAPVKPVAPSKPVSAMPISTITDG